MACGLRPNLDAGGPEAGVPDGQVIAPVPLDLCLVSSHAGYVDGGTQDTCVDALDFGGARLAPERFSVSANGCVTSDAAAAAEGPEGGMLADGDYDLVRFRSNIFDDQQSRRTLRIFDGGTYIEWVVENEDPSAPDGGFDQFRYDTAIDVSGNTLNVHHTCGPVIPTATYGFTAAGDQLTLFNYRDGSGPLDSIYTYQRTCSR